jgi:flavin reductase (DIM6/NTAB) family NADH-FMN oxidoreductase RutF
VDRFKILLNSIEAPIKYRNSICVCRGAGIRWTALLHYILLRDGAKGRVSKQLYRDGMSRYAAAVNIVTTDGPAGPTGFTASAACSVTDDPPTLLVCLNRYSQLHTIFQENGVFCLNTLAGDQRELSEAFGRRSETSMRERFAEPIWGKTAMGSPVLLDALVSFDCRIAEVHEVGTHWVIFGEVQDIRISDRASALLYANRWYRELLLKID